MSEVGAPIMSSMIIDEDVTRYRNGGCFTMSMALHRLTGYPERCIDFGNCTHAFVVTDAGTIMDIHGENTWDNFLTMLVKDGALSAESVALGKVKHIPIPGDENIYWRHRGYKTPSESAIKKAISIAKKHPNLADVLPSHLNSPEVKKPRL